MIGKGGAGARLLGDVLSRLARLGKPVDAFRRNENLADPVLRLWVRLHGQATPPGDEDLAREAQEYAVNRFPYLEPALALAESAAAATDSVGRDRSWSIIEID